MTNTCKLPYLPAFVGETANCYGKTLQVRANEVLLKKQLNQGIALLFVVDATGSMDEYIEATRTKIEDICREFRIKWPTEELFVVGYFGLH